MMADWLPGITSFKNLCVYFNVFKNFQYFKYQLKYKYKYNG